MISMIFGMNEIGIVISEERGTPPPTVLRKPAAGNDENQIQRGPGASMNAGTSAFIIRARINQPDLVTVLKTRD